MNGQTCKFSELEIGELFKIEGIYHIQVKVVDPREHRQGKHIYHSAEHRCVVLMDPDPEMIVTRYKE